MGIQQQAEGIQTKTTKKNRKTIKNPILFCVICWFFLDLTSGIPHKVSSKSTEELRRNTKNSKQNTGKLKNARKNVRKTERN